MGTPSRIKPQQSQPSLNGQETAVLHGTVPAFVPRERPARRDQSHLAVRDARRRPDTERLHGGFAHTEEERSRMDSARLNLSMSRDEELWEERVRSPSPSPGVLSESATVQQVVTKYERQVAALQDENKRLSAEARHLKSFYEGMLKGMKAMHDQSERKLRAEIDDLRRRVGAAPEQVRDLRDFLLSRYPSLTEAFRAIDAESRHRLNQDAFVAGVERVGGPDATAAFQALCNSDTRTISLREFQGMHFLGS